MLAKKFELKRSRKTSFIFKDPKDAAQFYHFVNNKYNSDHKDVDLATPFQLNGNTYYLSY